MEQLGIDLKCPACGYCLKGLPATYRCPECAFEYESDMLVLRPSGKWRLFVLVLVPLVVAGALLGITGNLLRRTLGIPYVDIYVLVFFGIALVRYLIDLRKPQFLVMRSTDIHWQKRGKKTVTIAWSQIVEIRPNRFSEMVVLERRDGSKTGIPREFWPKATTIGDFADLVRKRWQQAAVEHATKQSVSSP
jgi:hypothetical protein